MIRSDVFRPCFHIHPYSISSYSEGTFVFMHTKNIDSLYRLDTNRACSLRRFEHGARELQ
jgi:hypothetical protein